MRALGHRSNFVVFAGLAGLLFASASCKRNNLANRSNLGTAEERAAKLDLAADRMLVTFSDKTEILGFNHASFLDEIVTVKVRMPISDVDEFIKTSPFKGVQLRDDRRYVHTDESLTWMDPEGAVRFKSGQVTIRDTQGLNILIDLDDNEQAIVYLEWFTT